MDKWSELRATGEPGEAQARLRRHDGVFRWFLFRTRPLRDENGKIVRWYAASLTFMTLSKRKKSCEKMNAICGESPMPFRRQLSS